MAVGKYHMLLGKEIPRRNGSGKVHAEEVVLGHHLTLFSCRATCPTTLLLQSSRARIKKKVKAHYLKGMGRRADDHETQNT
jgi:hypothetical protein